MQGLLEVSCTTNCNTIDGAGPDIDRTAVSRVSSVIMPQSYLVRSVYGLHIYSMTHYCTFRGKRSSLENNTRLLGCQVNFAPDPGLSQIQRYMCHFLVMMAFYLE